MRFLHGCDVMGVGQESWAKSPAEAYRAICAPPCETTSCGRVVGAAVLPRIQEGTQLMWVQQSVQGTSASPWVWWLSLVLIMCVL